MSKRVGLLGLLLVLALGTGVVAQSPSPMPSPSSQLSLSPEPTPLFAPDDLAFLLPSRIGDVEMDVFELGVADLMDSAEEREKWRDLLLPIGNEPADVHGAASVGFATVDRDPANGDLYFEVLDSSGEPRGGNVALMALRIDGITAEALSAHMLAMMGEDEATGEWLEVMDRRVMRVDSGGGVHLLMYPKGEVLFVAMVAPETGLSDTDLLAELP